MELSRNLQFEVLKSEGKLVLRCDRKAVLLPTQVKWHEQVYIHPKTKVPCLTDGSKTSKPCITFFQNEADYIDEPDAMQALDTIDANSLVKGVAADDTAPKIFTWKDGPQAPTTGSARMAGLKEGPRLSEVQCL